MNALQQFIQDRPFGFVTEAELPALIALDRLCPLLVRCGGCRFTAGAQYIAHLVKCIEAGGDYVRDVSFPVGSIEAAAEWQCYETEKPKVQQRHLIPPTPEHMKTQAERFAGGRTFDGEESYSFSEGDCGGVFDGNSVSSDADPGL